LTSFFEFQLESAVNERTNLKKQFDEQTLILLAEIKTTKKLNYDRLILRLPVVGTTQQGSVG